MKKIILGIIILLFLGGCGSRYSLAKNGLYYEANSNNCPKTRLVGNIIQCYDKNGRFLYSRRPVNPAMVQNERIENQRSYDRTIANINATTAYNNRTTAMMMSGYNPYRY